MKAWKCNQIDLWRGMAFSSFQRYCLLFPFASSTTNASVVKNKDWLLIVREALTRRPKQQDFILRGCFPPAILLTITVCWIIEGGPHRFSARLSFAKSYLSSFFRQSSFEVSTKSFKVCRRVGTLLENYSKCRIWMFWVFFNFWQFFGSFLSNQNVNVARFARNVEWDFFCDFQTPCVSNVRSVEFLNQTMQRDYKCTLGTLVIQSTDTTTRITKRKQS